VVQWQRWNHTTYFHIKQFHIAEETFTHGTSTKYISRQSAASHEIRDTGGVWNPWQPETSLGLTEKVLRRAPENSGLFGSLPNIEIRLEKGERVLDIFLLGQCMCVSQVLDCNRIII
jgi:hypothetical protein